MTRGTAQIEIAYTVKQPSVAPPVRIDLKSDMVSTCGVQKISDGGVRRRKSTQRRDGVERRAKTKKQERCSNNKATRNDKQSREVAVERRAATGRLDKPARGVFHANREAPTHIVSNQPV